MARRRKAKYQANSGCSPVTGGILLLSVLLVFLLQAYGVPLSLPSVAAILLGTTASVWAAVATSSILRAISQEAAQQAIQIADVDSMGGLQFEHYVAALLRHQGHEVQVTKASGDLGVDVTARHGRRKYAIQVKRQADPVSRRAVSDAVAGKAAYGCNAAMVVTNHYFTADARKLANATGCDLVNRDLLTRWIQDYQARGRPSLLNWAGDVAGCLPVLVGLFGVVSLCVWLLSSRPATPTPHPATNQVRDSRRRHARRPGRSTPPDGTR